MTSLLRWLSRIATRRPGVPRRRAARRHDAARRKESRQAPRRPRATRPLHGAPRRPGLCRCPAPPDLVCRRRRMARRHAQRLRRPRAPHRRRAGTHQPNCSSLPRRRVTHPLRRGRHPGDRQRLHRGAAPRYGVMRHSIVASSRAQGAMRRPARHSICWNCVSLAFTTVSAV